MDAGRAAAFDAETIDFGSVRGRSSGPVEVAKGVHRLQQVTTSSKNDWRILISTSVQQGPDHARRVCVALAGVHHRGLGAYSSNCYITDFPIQTGRRLWGEHAALPFEAAQLLDCRQPATSE
jgi:hypothetical protein